MASPLPGSSASYLHDTWTDLALDYDVQVSSVEFVAASSGCIQPGSCQLQATQSLQHAMHAVTAQQACKIAVAAGG